MRVSLLSSTQKPFSTIVKAARECYKSEATSLASDKALFLHMVKNEESPLEHASWTFLVEGISRVCSHQLVRHRIASYSQQSQRYVKQDKDYIIPQGLDRVQQALYCDFMDKANAFYRKLIQLGVKRETARYCLPQGWSTSLVVTFNLRSFCNFVHLRCSKKAQQEIHDLAKLMLTIVTASMPTEVLADFLEAMMEKADVKFI